jgi:hypothetical protein
MSKRVKDLVELSWLNLGKDLPEHVLLPKAFAERPPKDNPLAEILNIISDPDNFYFTVKHIFGIELLPFQLCVLRELWTKKYPMLIASRGAGKSFILALYAMLRALINQGAKIIIVGAAFRQAKVVFEYCEKIWNDSPVLKSMCAYNGRSGPRKGVDRCECIIGDSIIIALPLGDGTKIRGQRAHYIIADEFASIPEDIYENVVSGFAAVSANVVQNVKNQAKIEALQQFGILTKEQKLELDSANMGNQAILSGTAYYDFNHFSKYWKKYCAFIKSRGDAKKLLEYYPDGVPESFNYRDYSVIRIPVDILPKGFMDEKHVARSKATVHSGIYKMEFGACFATDSEGFFKRSLIESCVTKEPINGIQFSASLKGNSRAKHVFGVDPASERDNFSIVVLEVCGNYRKVVYVWTTNRAAHKERLKRGLVREQDFYGFCARKIRELMESFPCERIIMDSQGGGVAVEEALHDSDKLFEGEQQIWRVIDEEDPQDSDDYQGLHILEMVNFANAEWVSQANHGLRKDFEDKNILFPYFDSLSLGFAAEEDNRTNRIFDTLEDCVTEIEELKDELATIIHTQTGTSGRDHWDTPQVKIAGGKKGRLRKDRYSSLVLANMSARTMSRAPTKTEYNTVGGFAKDMAHGKSDYSNLYSGAGWYKIPSDLYSSVHRKGGV